MSEEWRDIPGYNGAYQISDLGNVRSFRYRGRLIEKPRTLTPYVHVKHGHSVAVKLTDSSGVSKDKKVLKLMVEVWKGGCPSGMVAYHKNGILTDNSVFNIGFISRKRLGSKTGGKSRRKPVAKVSQFGEVIDFYPSARQAAKHNHMSYQAVIDRCNRMIKNEFALDGSTYRWDEKMRYT